MAIHEAWIDELPLGVDGFRSGVTVHDVVFATHGDELTVFHGKGPCLAESGIDGIDGGVVDDEVHRGFMDAGGHNQGVNQEG